MSAKAAFVAVVGRPSAGKSTLVNQMCGEKVSIVSAVPQTTRNAIRGIVNREQGQLVFIDTPGRHKSEKKFNKKLTDISGRAVDDSDIMLYVLDASRLPGPEEAEIAALLAPAAEKTIAAINKIDINNDDCGRIYEFLAQALPGLSKDRCFRISAKNNTGIDALLTALYDISPEGEPFYGEEYYTDQEVEFRIAEIIREQAVNRLRQELPHALYVEIADAQFSGEAAPQSEPQHAKLWVRAFIVVERESQKGMVVGKGGAMIKDIRLAALKELRSIFDWKIELDLRVKTGKDWRHNDRILRRITEG
ncbi:MAG: GTPase Era [Treponema sp.]|nr:GTPase Era [Treponema sp.]